MAWIELQDDGRIDVNLQSSDLISPRKRKRPQTTISFHGNEEMDSNQRYHSVEKRKMSPREILKFQPLNCTKTWSQLHCRMVSTSSPRTPALHSPSTQAAILQNTPILVWANHTRTVRNRLPPEKQEKFEELPCFSEITDLNAFADEQFCQHE